MSSVYSPLEMFYRWEQETPDLVFLRQSKGDGTWDEYTWREVAERVRRIAHYLRAQNLAQGSRIGIWSSNSADWIMVDLAIMLSGHISVPLYPGQSCASARFVLEQAEVALIFMGPCGQEHQIEKALTPDIKTVAIHACQLQCETTLASVIQSNPVYQESPIPNHDDLLTIVYSSGTSGKPCLLYTSPSPRDH